MRSGPSTNILLAVLAVPLVGCETALNAPSKSLDAAPSLDAIGDGFAPADGGDGASQQCCPLPYNPSPYAEDAISSLQGMACSCPLICSYSVHGYCPAIINGWDCFCDAGAWNCVLNLMGGSICLLPDGAPWPLPDAGLDAASAHDSSLSPNPDAARD
jgi:hypothetical protein